MMEAVEEDDHDDTPAAGAVELLDGDGGTSEDEDDDDKAVLRQSKNARQLSNTVPCSERGLADMVGRPSVGTVL